MVAEYNNLKNIICLHLPKMNKTDKRKQKVFYKLKKKKTKNSTIKVIILIYNQQQNLEIYCTQLNCLQLCAL